MGNETARRALFQSAEFKTAMQNRQTYHANANPDGTYSAEEVPPGNYEFWCMVMRIPSSTGSTPSTNGPAFVAIGKIDFTVSANTPSGALDAGTIELSPTPTAQ